MENLLTKEKHMEKKNEKVALVMGIFIGLIIGVFSTYLYMKSVEKKIEEENEKEKISITEKLSQEIAKLSLKNSAYTFVDTINSRIKEEKKVVKGTYVMKEDGIFYEADEETTEFINGGAKIDSLKFEDKKLSVNSIVIINDKGTISEAVFYVDEYKITYDLIGTTVTRLDDISEGK